MFLIICLRITISEFVWKLILTVDEYLFHDIKGVVTEWVRFQNIEWEKQTKIGQQVTLDLSDVTAEYI